MLAGDGIIFELEGKYNVWSSGDADIDEASDTPARCVGTLVVAGVADAGGLFSSMVSSQSKMTSSLCETEEVQLEILAIA